MKSVVYFFPVFFLAEAAFGQSIEVEYDKKRDFTIYKTFAFGESQITTPKDQKQVEDATLHKWITDAITRELQQIGLQKSDQAADLIITYAEGTLARTDSEQLGPLALTPGANPDRNFTFQYRQSSLIIDMNDRSNNLIWRINSITNMTSAEIERTVDVIVEKGFRKFAKAYRKKKR
jgi:hypothetical protein